MVNMLPSAPRSLAALFVVLPALGMLSGCDPCAGVVGCLDEAQAAVEGEIIVYATGEPAAGVVIQFHRTGGPELRSDTETAATTDPDGRFRLRLRTVSEGELVGSITVRPPGRPEYVIEDQVFRSTALSGDGAILRERWVVDPYIEFLGELYDRTTGRSIGYGAHVTFTRTAGVQIEPDSVKAVTDHFGRFFFSPTPLAQGEVIGDLRIAGVVGGGYYVTTIPDVRMTTSHVERTLGVQEVWYLGASLAYVGELRYRGSGESVVDAEVEFRRTGGIQASPEHVLVRTNGTGRFPLQLTPASAGILIGDLTVRPGFGLPTEVFRDVEVPTFEANGLRLLKVWSIGPSLRYTGRLLTPAGAPVVGREVRVVRTGGISVREGDDAVEATTGSDGFFHIAPMPLEDGELQANLEIDVPGSSAPQVIPVTLSTFREDGERTAGSWVVP